MSVELVRLEEAEDGTFGVMLIDGHVFCVTLEPPDKDNKSNISNILPGYYNLRRVNSPKYGMTFQVEDVPGRSHILIHSGNVPKHTKGCILIAQYFGKLRGNRAVLNSGNTFKAFMAAMEGIDITGIDITEV